MKGTHYPPGKEPKEGAERKLYLLLQAHDELSLRRAKDEIIRIMRETLRQMVRVYFQQRFCMFGRILTDAVFRPRKDGLLADAIKSSSMRF